MTLLLFSVDHHDLETGVSSAALSPFLRRLESVLLFLIHLLRLLASHPLAQRAVTFIH